MKTRNIMTILRGILADVDEPRVEIILEKAIRDINAFYVMCSLGHLPGPNETERKLYSSGKKVDAIKAYRDRTGAMLSESKTILDTFCGMNT